jgi:hypothetical protein
LQQAHKIDSNSFFFFRGENFSIIIPSIKEKSLVCSSPRKAQVQRPLIGGLFGVRDSKPT